MVQIFVESFLQRKQSGHEHHTGANTMAVLMLLHSHSSEAGHGHDPSVVTMGDGRRILPFAAC